MEAPDGGYLNEVPWFQDHFPADLCLKHAFNVFTLLTSLADLYGGGGEGKD